VIPKILTDTEWSKLLAMADPTIDALSEHAATVRQGVDWTLGYVFLGSQERLSPPDVTETLSAYAIGGEQFIRGMRALDSILGSLMMLESHWRGAQRIPPKPFFDQDLADKIESYCREFRGTEKILNAHFEAEQTYGPNSKPWLHDGVHHLYDLWCDELGQGMRPKKDFLAFAYAVLDPLKVGITQNSILESFDRHVKPNVGLRGRMRQLSSK
jgi:hypothetical protein